MAVQLADKLAAANIPSGRWTTYRDVAIAGGSPGGAQAVGTWLLRGGGIAGVWRVLNRHGEISPHWVGTNHGTPPTPEAVRQRLEEEGIRFDDFGRADPLQRWPDPEQPQEAETRR